MIVKYEGKAKIKLKCDDCGNERVVQRNTAILNKKEHPCKKCSNKRNGIAKRGIPSWNSGKRKPEHEIQKGSKYINHHGYVEIYVGESEAKKYGRNKGKYVIEHRKVMQDYLGREIQKGEIIHHIDGDKTNNDITNLYLCKNLSSHRDIHNQLEQFAFQLFKLGVIKFDNGRYIIAPQYRDVLSALGENGESLSHNKQ
ncbi:HNH endonuclease [Heyndrickxia sp. NPDC080065]|uniref:HNH endonuclease n=1 Tax=Heyndrickxia sp. NPDC080065 TaxID=3390568 RepID=UPI003D060E37